MDRIKIYRVRYIPMEKVDISGDEILFLDKDIMITRWNPINPRKDFAKGYSCTFLKKGYKISKIMNEKLELIYWYCDVISVEMNDTGMEYRFVDLLLDVKILPDGRVIVMDMDELAYAMENGLITMAKANQSLCQCNELLGRIYSGELIQKVENLFKHYCG